MGVRLSCIAVEGNQIPNSDFIFQAIGFSNCIRTVEIDNYSNARVLPFHEYFDGRFIICLINGWTFIIDESWLLNNIDDSFINVMQNVSSKLEKMIFVLCYNDVYYDKFYIVDKGQVVRGYSNSGERTEYDDIGVPLPIESQFEHELIDSKFECKKRPITIDDYLIIMKEVTGSDYLDISQNKNFIAKTFVGHDELYYQKSI